MRKKTEKLGLCQKNESRPRSMFLSCRPQLRPCFPYLTLHIIKFNRIQPSTTDASTDSTRHHHHSRLAYARHEYHSMTISCRPQLRPCFPPRNLVRRTADSTNNVDSNQSKHHLKKGKRICAVRTKAVPVRSPFAQRSTGPNKRRGRRTGNNPLKQSSSTTTSNPRVLTNCHSRTWTRFQQMAPGLGWWTPPSNAIHQQHHPHPRNKTGPQPTASNAPPRAHPVLDLSRTR
jgi:hypothetical protein